MMRRFSGSRAASNFISACATSGASVSHVTTCVTSMVPPPLPLDGPEVAGTDPADPFVRAVVASRRLATNHFTGWGYWIWFIPLRGGETSVGLVWDKRIIDPKGATPEDRFDSTTDSFSPPREAADG